MPKKLIRLLQLCLSLPAESCPVARSQVLRWENAKDCELWSWEGWREGGGTEVGGASQIFINGNNINWHPLLALLQDTRPPPPTHTHLWKGGAQVNPELTSGLLRLAHLLSVMLLQVFLVLFFNLTLKSRDDTLHNKVFVLYIWNPAQLKRTILKNMKLHN